MSNVKRFTKANDGEGLEAPAGNGGEGLVRSAAYTITYPLSLLPDLAAGHTVVIAGQTYQVRDVRAIGDGTERRADLTRL